ncbi:MAG: D-alanyl-D-alanine carboxypeptidase/D-alanyl-D-alanine-endopeptidase, partial [Pseudomonadota bacterium]
VVVDAGTGTVLEAMNADAGIAPASTAKAITALYALDTLGSSHRFKTRVIVTGGIKEGTVQGDLILAGGCDPTTDTRDFAALAAQMKEAGIIAVKGAFYVYEGPIASIRSIDPEQPDHLGYSPAVAGIALNFNRVHFEWTRSGESYKVSMDARAGRYRPEVEIARMQVERRRAPIYTYEDANGRDNWTVARSALGREGARWLPVRRPGLYAGEVFSTLARSHGVVLGSPKLISTLPQGQTVAEVLSDPLSDVVQGMLKYSNNMTAEMIGMAATHARLGGVPSLSASAAEMNTWAVEVLGMRTPAFADHSGLGSASRVTAADMAKGLAAAGRAEALRPLMKPVKLLDSKGRVTNTHPVKADAKTGTLNFVSGLAGYITAPGGRDMAFAIFAADEDKRATITREMRERPPGGRSYATRARKLQRQLIMRWGSTFDEAQG